MLRVRRLTAPVVLFSLCFFVRIGQADHIFRNLTSHASTQVEVGGYGANDAGEFESWSLVNSGSDRPFLETASANSQGNELGRWAGWHLKTYASIEKFANNTESGVASATAQAVWSDRFFVQAALYAPASLRFYYSLTGKLSSSALEDLSFGGSYAATLLSVYGTGSVSPHSNVHELRYGGTGDEEIIVNEIGFFDASLFATDIPGEFYGDFDIYLKSLAQESGFFNYNVKSDFFNTFYLIGATANGLSLEEAGVTLEFQSQLESAAVPEPPSFGLLCSGTLTMVFWHWRTCSFRKMTRVGVQRTGTRIPGAEGRRV